jgi:hypothetical protein
MTLARTPLPRDVPLTRRRAMHGEQCRAGPVGFDLDMTLIDSRRAILATWAALAAETGAPVDLADVVRRLGAKLKTRSPSGSRPGCKTRSWLATGGTT